MSTPDPFEELARQRSQETPAAVPTPAPAAAPTAPVSSTDPFADLARQRQSASNATLGVALTQKPDQVATNLRNAKDAGVAPTFAAAAPDETANLARQNLINKALANSDVTRSMMQDPTFAALAHDDVEKLYTLEQAFNDVKYIGRSFGAMGPIIPSALLKASAWMADTVRELAMMLPGDNTGYDPMLMQSKLSRVGAKALDAYGAELQGQNRGVTHGAQMVGEGVKSIPVSLAALAVGTVNPALGYTVMGGLTAAPEYVRAREEGLGYWKGSAYGVIQGGLEVATEKLPMDFLWKDVKAGSPFWKVLLRQMALENATEQVATLTQDATEWAFLNPDKTVDQFLAERPQAALDTLIATTAAVGLQTGLVSTVDRALTARSRKTQAEETRRVLDLLNKSVKDTKLHARSAETFAQFASQASDATNVYVEANRLAEALQAKGLSMQQLGQIDPEIAADLETALNAGGHGDVVVPIGRWASTLAQSAVGDSLLDHARLHEHALSTAEVADLEEASQAIVADAESRLNASPDGKERAASLLKVTSFYHEQLANNALFMNEQQRNDAVGLLRAYYANLSNTTGMLPEEIAFGKDGHDGYLISFDADPRVLFGDTPGFVRGLFESGATTAAMLDRLPDHDSFDFKESRAKLTDILQGENDQETKQFTLPNEGGSARFNSSGISKTKKGFVNQQRFAVLSNLQAVLDKSTLFRSFTLPDNRSFDYYLGMARYEGEQYAVVTQVRRNDRGNDYIYTVSVLTEDEIAKEREVPGSSTNQYTAPELSRNSAFIPGGVMWQGVDPSTWQPLPDGMTEIDVDGVTRTVFASDGSLIHPTIEGVTHFWRNFKNTKALDSLGRPIVVHHGTGQRFEKTEFDKKKRGSNTGARSSRQGYFFSGRSDTANSSDYTYSDLLTPEKAAAYFADMESVWSAVSTVLNDLRKNSSINFWAAFEGTWLRDVFFDDNFIWDANDPNVGMLSPDKFHEVDNHELVNASYIPHTVVGSGHLEDAVEELKDFLLALNNGAFDSAAWNKGSVSKKKLLAAIAAIDVESNRINEISNDRQRYQAGGHVYSMYLNFENPMVHDQRGVPYREKPFYELIREAKAAGHDSLIIKNTYDGGPLDDIYVAFENTQMKDATDNSGWFDTASGNFLEQMKNPFFNKDNPAYKDWARTDVLVDRNGGETWDGDGPVVFEAYHIGANPDITHFRAAPTDPGPPDWFDESMNNWLGPGSYFTNDTIDVDNYGTLNGRDIQGKIALVGDSLGYSYDDMLASGAIAYYFNGGGGTISQQQQDGLLLWLNLHAGTNYTVDDLKNGSIDANAKTLFAQMFGNHVREPLAKSMVFPHGVGFSYMLNVRMEKPLDLRTYGKSLLIDRVDTLDANGDVVDTDFNGEGADLLMAMLQVLRDSQTSTQAFGDINGLSNAISDVLFNENSINVGELQKQLKQHGYYVGALINLAARAAGYDGLVMDPSDAPWGVNQGFTGPGSLHFVPFVSENIKSVFNGGRFSRSPGAGILEQEDVSRSTFASPLVTVVNGGPVKGIPNRPKQGTSAEWKKWLDSVQQKGALRSEERADTGVDTWLAEQEGVITEQQVQEFVSQNQIIVNVVTLSQEDGDFDEDAYNDAVDAYVETLRQEHYQEFDTDNAREDIEANEDTPEFYYIKEVDDEEGNITYEVWQQYEYRGRNAHGTAYEDVFDTRRSAERFRDELNDSMSGDWMEWMIERAEEDHNDNFDVDWAREQGENSLDRDDYTGSGSTEYGDQNYRDGVPQADEKTYREVLLSWSNRQPATPVKTAAPSLHMVVRSVSMKHEPETETIRVTEMYQPIRSFVQITFLDGSAKVNISPVFNTDWEVRDWNDQFHPQWIGWRAAEVRRSHFIWRPANESPDDKVQMYGPAYDSDIGDMRLYKPVGPAFDKEDGLGQRDWVLAYKKLIDAYKNPENPNEPAGARAERLIHFSQEITFYSDLFNTLGVPMAVAFSEDGQRVTLTVPPTQHEMGGALLETFANLANGFDRSTASRRHAGRDYGTALKQIAQTFSYSSSLYVKANAWLHKNEPTFTQLASDSRAADFRRVVEEYRVEGQYVNKKPYKGNHYSSAPSDTFAWYRHDVYDGHYFVEDGSVVSKPIYRIQEVQSDPHQAAQDTGYASGSNAVVFAFDPVAMKFTSTVNGFASDTDPSPLLNLSSTLNDTGKVGVNTTANGRIIVKESGSPIPPLPFKKSWPLLVMRQALQHAVEADMSTLALVPGEVQATRWNHQIRQRMDTIELARKISTDPSDEFNPRRYSLKCYLNGTVVHQMEFRSGTQMRETLGAELLNRLVANMDANYLDPMGEGYGVVAGDDIKVGGTGIAKFYNERVVNDFGSAFKKFGMRMRRVRVYESNPKVQTTAVEITSAIFNSINGDYRVVERAFSRDVNDPTQAIPARSVMQTFKNAVGAESDVDVYADFRKMEAGQFDGLSARYFGIRAKSADGRDRWGPYMIPHFVKVPLHASQEEIDAAIADASAKVQAMYLEGVKTSPSASHELLVADIPPDLAAAIKGGSDQPLYQNGPRGKAHISFDDPRYFARIQFGAKSDYSSFVHEVSHFMLEVYTDMIRRGVAPDMVKEDMQTLLQWFNFNGTPEEWAALDIDTRRRAHEKFARTFELYTLNNQSPSAELGPLFARTRNYMLKVYEEFRGKFGYIAPEVKDVMARMLASRDAVASMTKARSETALLTPANRPENMSDSDWREYEAQARAANDSAEEITTARSLRDMKWLANARSKALRQLQDKVRQARSRVRSEVADEAAKLPVYRAMLLMTKGQIPDGEDLPRAMRRAALDLAQGVTSTKLSTEKLREIQGDGPAAPWRYLPTNALAAENGADPSMIAALAGFDSADAMVRAIVSAPKFNEYVEAKTDSVMMQRHGDMMDPQALERAADQAVHNAFRQKFLATELRALEMALGNKSNASQIAIAYGKRLVMQTPLKKLRFEAFAKAAQRAADAALTMFGKGKTREAANEKRNQLVNFVAAREAVRVAAQIDRAVKRLKSIQKKQDVRQAIGQDALDQMEPIMVRFGLMERPQNQQPRNVTLADYVASQDALGIGLDLAPIVLDETMSKPLDELSVEEALDVLNALRQIEQSGRNARKLLAVGRRATLQQIKAEVLPTISAAADGKVVDNTTRNTFASRAAKLFRGFFAIHRKLASLALELDGFQQAGPLWNALIRPMNMAGNREAGMRHQATKALAALLEPLKPGPKFSASLHIPALNRSMTREERIAFALNVGNEGNLQRLMDGGNFTRDQVDAVLDTLTQQEWQFVQGVWDLFESYKPMIREKERRVTGLEPNWIEATEVVTKFGPLRGGYYPIKYDKATSAASQQFADAEDAKQLMRAAFTASTTRRSFTKSRASRVTGRPLLLTLAGIDQGLNEVIHDLCWHEYVITANMILSDRDIDSAIRTGWGAEVVQTMKDTIKAIATEDQQQNNAFMQVLGKLRANTTVVGLGFNLVTAAMQVTGFAQSAVRIGPRYLGRGVRQYFTAPLTEIDNVRNKSEFMANRMRTMQREINELLNTVSTGAAKERMTSAAMAFIAQMQLQVDMPTWLGAYEQATTEAPLGLNADQVEARAVALADQAVIDAQGGGQIGDLAEVQRGNNLVKLFTNFYSFFNVTWNLNVERTKMRAREGQWIGMATDLVMINVLPAVLGLMIRASLTAGGGDDDDEWYDHIPGEVASFMLGQLVGLREISASVKAAADTAMDSSAFGFDYQGPAGLRWVAEFGKVMKQTSQGEIDMPLIKSVINLIGLTTGIPTAQLSRTLEGAAAMANGDTSDPRALVTGAPK